MSAMNNFPAGTRVSFHEASGTVRTGAVQSTSHLADGTLIAVVQPDGGGGTVNIPVAALIRSA
ncbi:uncharacterized protein FOMMEDRAFT_153123 [Fomitiporia mediterranea MF3/22]|uniref:uncharacterized protein n=1 Tax=Fomitiporia mediterranea (strain MF3/22) TaxID=694068 RepID=UPI0004408212|nr:uncharacterized protein FOMMEDRAFT_153123 [Fomitiporia mediterranea MF3/22]EJD05781.1 hypothetical protein FOMMEDRAFT_153123 [Fomitiporia mediterranea MF3/22]